MTWVVIVQFPSTTPVVIGLFADQAEAEERATEMNGMFAHGEMYASAHPVRDKATFW